MTTAVDGWEVLARARELSERGQAFALATVVWRRGPSSGKEGYRAIVTAAGQLHGWIGGACAEPAVVREARRAIAEGTPRLMFLGPPDELDSAGRDGVVSVPISCQSEGALEVYVEPVTPRPHVVVIGRSPMTETLVDLAAAVGWQTVLVDPDGGSVGQPPSAGRVVAGLDLDAAGVSERSAVVVATQGHDDEEALEQALGHAPAYVGLVASRQRGEAVLGYLSDRGVPPTALERVRVPAGLDLGPVAHREIAVAILAELVRLRAADGLGGAPCPPTPPGDEAVDPVCGMTVDVAAARHQVAHGGRTFYFCCRGCRGAFDRDPAAFGGTSSTP